MMFEKATKDVFDLTKIGFGLGVGAVGLASLNQQSAQNVATGLGNLSSFLPATGSILGAGLLIGTTREVFDIFDKI